MARLLIRSGGTRAADSGVAPPVDAGPAATGGQASRAATGGQASRAAIGAQASSPAAVGATLGAAGGGGLAGPVRAAGLVQPRAERAPGRRIVASNQAGGWVTWRKS